MKMSRLLITGCLLLTAAGCGKIPAPWYTEYFPLAPLAARYDESGMLHVLWVAQDQTLHYGTLDPEGDSRTPQDLGAITLDGAPVIDEYGQDSADIAPRPGTDEVWAYVNGFVGRFTPGTAQLTTMIDLTTGPGTTQDIGALAFADENTLHTGSQYLEWRVYEIADDGTPGDWAPQPITYAEGNSEMLPAPCQIDIADGFAYGQPCGWLSVAQFDLATGLSLSPPPEDEDYYVHYMALPVAATGRWGLVNSLSNYCLLEIGDEGLMRSERDIDVQDQYCDGYQFYSMGLTPNRADVAPDGNGFVVVYDRIGLFLLTGDEPENFESDKTGTWCSLYVGGIVSSITFAEDGTLEISRPDNSGTEILYAEKTWDQSARTVTTRYTGQATGYETYGDEEFEHWALRSGDTLVIRSTTDEDSASHLVDSGFTSLSGHYYYCGAN